MSNILADMTDLLESLEIPVETAVYSETTPAAYAVLTPILDAYKLHGDDKPGCEVQSVCISLFCQRNYLALKRRVCAALLKGDFTIANRRYIEFDTGYHHYSIDVEQIYNELEE